MGGFLTVGQASDPKEGRRLLKTALAFNPGAVGADKAYDTNAILDGLKDRGVEAVIPPRANRTEQREFDRELYRERNVVERCFGRMKSWRRLCLRSEKRAVAFMSWVFIQSIFMKLKMV